MWRFNSALTSEHKNFILQANRLAKRSVHTASSRCHFCQETTWIGPLSFLKYSRTASPKPLAFLFGYMWPVCAYQFSCHKWLRSKKLKFFWEGRGKIRTMCEHIPVSLVKERGEEERRKGGRQAHKQESRRAMWQTSMKNFQRQSPIKTRCSRLFTCPVLNCQSGGLCLSW